MKPGNPLGEGAKSCSLKKLIDKMESRMSIASSYRRG